MHGARVQTNEILIRASASIVVHQSRATSARGRTSPMKVPEFEAVIPLFQGGYRVRLDPHLVHSRHQVFSRCTRRVVPRRAFAGLRDRAGDAAADDEAVLAVAPAG